MRLPVVFVSEAELARAERDEWRRRAELVALELGRPRPASVRPARWPHHWSRTVVAISILVIGIALGSIVLPGAPHRAIRPDYPRCIGKARYEAPIHGNQYQELVNALYACRVYSSQ
jgi:hypothetical protein